MLPQGLSERAAREFLHANRGKRYDPCLVDDWLALLAEAPAVAPGAATHGFKSNGLMAGMVLAQDLVSRDGILMLARGHALDQALIERIQNIERTLDWDFTIYVQEQGARP